MMYLCCPTCGYFIGQKTMEYEKGKDKICSNPLLTPEERENEISTLILSLKVRRYCCKMRILTYKDIVKDILPANP